jgi:hypothetical protein
MLSLGDSLHKTLNMKCELCSNSLSKNSGIFRHYICLKIPEFLDSSK